MVSSRFCSLSLSVCVSCCCCALSFGFTYFIAIFHFSTTVYVSVCVCDVGFLAFSNSVIRSFIFTDLRIFSDCLKISQMASFDDVISIERERESRERERASE